jgi:hypothetical protein
MINMHDTLAAVAKGRASAGSLLTISESGRKWGEKKRGIGGVEVDGERGIFHRGRTHTKKLRWGDLSLMLGPTLQEFSVH